ncbi:hypothetical protein QE418_000851 [Microbacterium testaceum]|uniref:hypothetical protein n=1 Tax=Microbacterium TaxID=33882 RepID=UPI0027864A01|nr:MULTISPECIES: hypothetical protein [Microbacterium]MDQ1111403.1 hypothetical protein [Microbacterium testaceum]MDR6098059.1 hypothetical protein [Microbacterium sp. SORGH_AS_0454]
MSSRQKPGDSWSANRDHPDRAEWIELAVESGRASLLAQRDELSGMRTRAVAFGALTITASAFLVGTGLANAQRNAVFYIIAALGTLAFASMAFFLWRMVAPKHEFKFILDPKALVDWVEGAQPAPSLRVAMRKLAVDTIPGMLNQNEASLNKIRGAYLKLLFSSIATLAIWVALVWIFT